MSRLKAIRLRDVPDLISDVAQRQRVSTLTAGRVVQAAGALRDAANLLDQAIQSAMRRELRTKSARWRAELAETLLAREVEDEEARAFVAALGADEDDAQ